MSDFKFRKGQEVRILHDNTQGKVIRSWNDGDGNEYLIKYQSDHLGLIGRNFHEKDLKSIDDKGAIMTLQILKYVGAFAALSGAIFLFVSTL